MADAFEYRCTEFPGMEGCPGHFVAGTRDEVLHHAELHARDTHGEDPEAWSAEDRQLVVDLIRPV